MKEEFVKRVVKYILSKKYPNIIDVYVTSERDMWSRFADDEKNYVYNIFLVNEDPEIFTDENEWSKLKELIRNTLKAAGIKQGSRIYNEFLDN